MEAIRGDARLPDIGQEDRAAVDPHNVTTEDLTASIDELTRKLSNMPEWSSNLLDSARSAELVAARWGGERAVQEGDVQSRDLGRKEGLSCRW